MNTLEITEVRQYITFEDTLQTLELVEQSLGVIEVGVQGPEGPPGVGSDKNFETVLSGQTDITIDHNLNKYPAISVFDSAGDEVEGDYTHINTNSVRLRFSAGFSGKAIFN